MLNFQFKKIIKRPAAKPDKFLAGADTGVQVLDSQCNHCRHYGGSGVCPAFPSGIPVGILAGMVDHSQPYPGDNGIRYEPNTD